MGFWHSFVLLWIIPLGELLNIFSNIKVHLFRYILFSLKILWKFEKATIIIVFLLFGTDKHMNFLPNKILFILQLAQMGPDIDCVLRIPIIFFSAENWRRSFIRNREETW